jgi:Meckel syndrome type 1 protein
MTGAVGVAVVLTMIAAGLAAAGASAPAMALIFAGFGFAAGPLSVAALTASAQGGGRQTGFAIILLCLLCVAAAAAWPQAGAWANPPAEPGGVGVIAWAVAGVAAVIAIAAPALAPAPHAAPPPAVEAGSQVLAATAVLVAAAAALLWAPHPSGAAAGAALGLIVVVHGLFAGAGAAAGRFPPSILRGVFAAAIGVMAATMLAAALRGQDPLDPAAFFFVEGGPSLGALGVEAGLALAVASGLALMHQAVLRAADESPA